MSASEINPSRSGDLLNQRLEEACRELWDSFVDPAEAYDDDGAWLPLGGLGGSAANAAITEERLCALRDECRILAATNEFAINGHENRISYLVGAGHSYRAIGRDDQHQSLAAEVQSLLDEFIEANRWHKRQQEIVRRLDRDGEAFLRFFADDSGLLRLRFVEPGQVAAPVGEMAASFGIVCDASDVETVTAYYIDGAAVDAAEIQHRKANVDVNVKRGLPLYYPVRKNLRRAEKLLRNMSAVAEIQSAIALIRKHRQGTRGGVQQFVSSQNDARPGQGNVRRFGPGTILDAHAGIEYDFPAAALDAAAYVAVLQAELRAVASRLVMPEFMLTSDASNANYASTMVAEGPAMRMFARLQADLMVDDLALMRRVVDLAVAAGRLPEAARLDVTVTASPPSLAVRDSRQEAETQRLLFESGLLSLQTWSQQLGLDYEREQANRRRHASSAELKLVD